MPDPEEIVRYTLDSELQHTGLSEISTSLATVHQFNFQPDQFKEPYVAVNPSKARQVILSLSTSAVWRCRNSVSKAKHGAFANLLLH